MKVKDILDVIEQNRWYKEQIEIYSFLPDKKNIGDVLKHNYKKWLEQDINEYKSNVCEVGNENN